MVRISECFRSIFFVAFLLSLARRTLSQRSSVLSPRCPPKCLCFSTTVRCMFLHLDRVPKVPSSTTVLDLRFNKIRHISPNTFVDLKNLNTLLLNNNHISKLQAGAFNGLRNLRYLYLYKNKIRHIEPGVFQDLTKLEQLYLHYNKINHLSHGAFSTLKRLKRLFLHNNRLQSIPKGAFKNLHALKRLRLDSNALVCDCQLMWLAEMVKEKQPRTQVAATCQSPSYLQGKSLTTLAENQFQCKGMPQITEEPSDVEVNFGGTAYFNCKVEGDPQPKIIWLHNNEVIEDNPRVRVRHDGTLMIANTQGNDMGFYECKAINKMGETYSRRAKIVMADVPVIENTTTQPASTKPRFVRVPSDKNATLGSSVKLECRTSGIPAPTISWTKNNNPVASNARIKTTEEGTLVIAEVQPDDKGVYRCQAANYLGRVTSHARLRLFSPPHFTVEPNDVYTNSGGFVIFACEAFGEPNPIFYWYKNDVLVRPSRRYNLFVGGQRLRIQDVKQSDEGNYICKASNLAGSVEAEATLYVRNKVAPVIQTEPNNLTIVEGHEVTMPCRAKGRPRPIISWRRDGQTMSNGSKHRIESDGSLRIFSISSSDDGIYECTAANSVGYATARAILSFKPVSSTNHIGDQFLEESFVEAREKVNKAYNDTISELFTRDKGRPRHPHELLRIFRFPRLEGRDIAKIAETIEQTLDIVQRHVEAGMKFNLSEFSYADLLSPTKLRTLADLSGCLAHRKPVISCDDMCFHLKYRTLDGTCNNLKNPMWGASLTGFKRELKPAYENGFNTPVGWSRTKKYHGFFKPSSRSVSTRLLSTEAITADHHCTHMLMQWGQFLDHDIDHALPAISTESFATGVSCQRSCENSAPCFPIEIPTDDPRVHSHRCMEFTRSSAVCGSGVSSVFFEKILPREQINQLTSFIDASQIYSSSNPELLALRNRTFQYGQLRGGIPSPYGTGKLMLPFSNGSPIDCRRDHTESAIDCFLAGDIRANEQLGLLSMHTLWFREHNRIAEELRFVNPHWDSDTLFHETRKIIGALAQHITYDHWLPHILGPGGMKKIGPYDGYKTDIEPTISNVFAASAYRFGHTLINPELQRLNSHFQPIAEGHLPLHKAFFSPWRLIIEGGIDPILRGLFVTPAKDKKDGQYLNAELTEKLFRSAHEVALDLAAINVQRGRDHGLPSYTEWRRFCNLSVPETFNDLAEDMSLREIRSKLRQLYGHPGNVDLFVGGLLEDPIDGGRIGPTLSCLLIHQFKKLRDGDRFWHENPGVFKPDQLVEIKRATLGSVLCENGDNITDVTKDVFILPQEQSPSFVPCAKVPKMNLLLWSECCTDCRNAGFFNSLQRSAPQRFRRSPQFSFKEDRDHELKALFDNLKSFDIPFNSSAEGNNELLHHIDFPQIKPQRENDRFLSEPFKKVTFPVKHPSVLLSNDNQEDPLDGYVKDVTEERIEGVEALVEQLSNTVMALTRKIRRLERFHRTDEVKKSRKTCIDEAGIVRKRGEKWLKDDCTKCVCRPKGVRCKVMNCPDPKCENPVWRSDSCCPTC